MDYYERYHIFCAKKMTFERKFKNSSLQQIRDFVLQEFLTAIPSPFGVSNELRTFEIAMGFEGLVSSYRIRTVGMDKVYTIPLRKQFWQQTILLMDKETLINILTTESY